MRLAFCGVMQSTRLPPMAAMNLAAMGGRFALSRGRDGASGPPWDKRLPVRLETAGRSRCGSASIVSGAVRCSAQSGPWSNLDRRPRVRMARATDPSSSQVALAAAPPAEGACAALMRAPHRSSERQKLDFRCIPGIDNVYNLTIDCPDAPREEGPASQWRPCAILPLKERLLPVARSTDRR
jgi:hypothetical protein